MSAVGAASAASFYAPIGKVRQWSWETTWAVAGLFSWIILPIGVSLLLSAGEVPPPAPPDPAHLRETLYDPQHPLQQSQAAVNAGRGPEALRDALAAKELEPWASTPRLQLALIEEQAGNLAAARKQIHEATRRNPHDWQLWLTASRIELKSGDVASAQRALVRARRLNPLSPVFTATAASQP